MFATKEDEKKEVGIVAINNESEHGILCGFIEYVPGKYYFRLWFI